MQTRIGTVLAVVALAVFAVGLAIVPLTLPVATRAGTSAFVHPEEIGMSRDRVVVLAEGVRAFVAGEASAEKALPEIVDGRPGFDAAAVAHLADVRGVLRQVALATGTLAGLLTLWMAWSLVHKRVRDIAWALRAAAGIDAALVLVTGVWAALDFASFFSAFHGLFFSAGTWTFPSDSLLIQLFPEQFWVAAGIAWGVLVIGLASLYALAARGLLLEGRANREG